MSANTKEYMIKTCEFCSDLLVHSNDSNTVNLEESFTKVGDCLHLGIDNKTICKTLADYVPETIILAGNGAVEIKDGTDCWRVLTKEMEDCSLVGEKGYKDPVEGLTFLAACHDLFNHTVDWGNSVQWVVGYKKRIIGGLNKYETHARDMYCTCCNKRLSLPNSKKILVLTTNWDLGLLKGFSNVVQLHGRCDYPERAILPLQNISSLMATCYEDLKKGGILPGTFLGKCLKRAKRFIFWGTGLNDYDAVLWHFLSALIRANKQGLEIGIASKDVQGFEESQKKILKYFPSISINKCICSMIPS